MFTNFFDSKSIKNFLNKNQPNPKGYLVNRDYQRTTQKDNRNTTNSPINKSNVSANVPDNSNMKNDRKCTTPDNQTKKTSQQYKHIFQKQKNNIFQEKGQFGLGKQQTLEQEKKEKREGQQLKFNNFIQNTKTNPKLNIKTGHKLNIYNIQNNINMMKEQLQQYRSHKVLNSKNSNDHQNKSPSNQHQQQITNLNSKRKDSDINIKDEMKKKQKEKNQKLLYYMKINDWEQCFQLISKKSPTEVDVNCRDESESTPLHYACMNNNIQLVTLLLAKDANVNAQNNSGMTGLMIASQKGYEQIVENLIKQNTDVNKKDIYDNTALHYACLVSSRRSVELLLSVTNIDVTIQNFENKPAFEMTKNKEILQIFNSYFMSKNQYKFNNISRSKQMTTMSKQTTDTMNQQSNTPIQKDNNSNLNITIQKEEFSEDILSSFNQLATVGPNDFHVHGLLGKGSFGEVYLVEKKDTQEIFAMKSLDKSRIQKHNLINYAMTERNVLSNINHPFIVKLNYAFQTKDKLFLILEFAPGGDLGDHLQKEQKFSEEKTKIYLCEIILALEELHNKGVIFRDLKPENVVLDQDGHALLTDFGLSKEGVFDPNAGARSFCGSVAYLAPEMLKRQGHGKAVDWYLLGVVMYEMLVGLPPYYANSKEQLFHNIENAQLKFPNYISPEAKSLLKALLQRNPMKRLGSSKLDHQEIKQHPFFSDVDWHQIYNRDQKTPRINHKIRINPKYNNANVFSESINKDDKNYISGWSFVNREN